MKEKITYGLSVIILSIIICYALIKYYPSSGVTYVTSAADNRSKSELEQIYDVNFIMSKVPSGNMMIFLPSVKYCEYEEAERLAKLFGITSRNGTESPAESVSGYEFVEFEDGYLFSNEESVLRVSKYGGKIEYDSIEITRKSTSIAVSEEQAADLCARYISERFPEFTYEEVEINFDDNVYEITFIGRLANLRNFAFPVSARVGLGGEIIGLSMFFNTYDKLCDTKIKSMAEAYFELPVDFQEEMKVDLKKCALVYHYQDSLVQPAYMFEGEISGGRNFKCFVNAAMYKY